VSEPVSDAAGPSIAPKPTRRDVSVVIALKDDTRIFDCLKSVDADVEIVLSLNGTPTDMKRRLEQHPDRPIIVEIPEVGNLGAAYNAGIAAASGRYILLMDSDCLFAAGTIGTMYRLVLRYPVVKGQVIYDTDPGILSSLIARIREFDEGDYVSALSPPLLFDRTLVSKIGGHYFDPLIHWCEDREFDFRLQLAGIPVLYEASAEIFHGAQRGAQNLRSYWRYGIGEGIGQQLGVFTTPGAPVVWRLYSDLAIVVSCMRRKGILAGLYYAVTLAVFHAGTVWHLLADPFSVRARYPKTAERVRILHSIPQHCTALTERQKAALRAHHRRAGRLIDPCLEYQSLMQAVVKPGRPAPVPQLAGSDT
jgi:Glycosyl transferase family 2